MPFGLDMEIPTFVKKESTQSTLKKLSIFKYFW